MSDQDHINEALENAERFQRLFVTPVVDAVKQEMQTSLRAISDIQNRHAGMLEAHNDEIARLKSTQKKALIGWGVLSMGVASAISASFAWLKSHFRISV